MFDVQLRRYRSSLTSTSPDQPEAVKRLHKLDQLMEDTAEPA